MIRCIKGFVQKDVSSVQSLNCSQEPRDDTSPFSTLFSSLRAESSVVDTTLEGSFHRENDGFGWEQCMQRNRKVERAWPCINKSRPLLRKKAMDRETSNLKLQEATPVQSAHWPHHPSNSPLPLPLLLWGSVLTSACPFQSKWTHLYEWPYSPTPFGILGSERTVQRQWTEPFSSSEHKFTAGGPNHISLHHTIHMFKWQEGKIYVWCTNKWCRNHIRNFETYR